MDLLLKIFKESINFKKMISIHFQYGSPLLRKRDSPSVQLLFIYGTCETEERSFLPPAYSTFNGETDVL